MVAQGRLSATAGRAWANRPTSGARFFRAGFRQSSGVAFRYLGAAPVARPALGVTARAAAGRRRARYAEGAQLEASAQAAG